MAEKEIEKKATNVRNTIRDKATSEKPEAASNAVNEKEKKPRKKNEKKDVPESAESASDKSSKKERKPFRNPLAGLIQQIRNNERLHKLTGAFLLFIVFSALPISSSLFRNCRGIVLRQSSFHTHYGPATYRINEE